MLYSGMIWVYGSGRVDKANKICLRRYARVDDGIKRWNALTTENPLLGLKILNDAIK